MLDSVKRWVLPVAALAGLLLAGLTVTLIDGVPGLMRSPETVTPAAAAATVIRSVPCAEEGARDTVEIDAGGPIARYPLDACGNPVGFVLDVEIVSVDGESTARLAGTGGAEPAVVNDRVGAVLLVLAGLGGASLMLFASRRRAPAVATAAPAAVGRIGQPYPDLPEAASDAATPPTGQAALSYAAAPESVASPMGEPHTAAMAAMQDAVTPPTGLAALPRAGAPQSAAPPTSEPHAAATGSPPSGEPYVGAPASAPHTGPSPAGHDIARRLEPAEPPDRPAGHAAEWTRATGTVQPPWTRESRQPHDAPEPTDTGLLPPRAGEPTGAWPVPN